MPPLDGVCSAFQFGTCEFREHHKTSDGRMALHICQPCVQFRMNFVDRNCGGGHPDHPTSCRLKKIGAVACPFQLLQVKSPDNHPTVLLPTVTQPTVTQPTVNQPNEEVDHAPSFSCPCNGCADFFGRLQDELDGYQIDFDIEDRWINLHWPADEDSKRDEDMCIDEDDEYDEDSSMCIGCDLVALPWSTLCRGCDNQFGGPEGFAAWESGHWMATSESDSVSDDDSYGS